LTIDDDDLMTEKHQDTIHFKSGSRLGWVGREENALFISATNKENFEERTSLWSGKTNSLRVFLTISFISWL
jgi:hypothetical protein